MDIQTFLTLSGIQLTEAQEDRYPYVIRRAESQLTRLLGWSATQRNLFEEVGKTSSACQCIDQSLSEEAYQQMLERLQEPDEEEGTYRLFPYSNLDTRLFIDPCMAVYKVKLVMFTRGSDQQFISMRTFKNWQALYSINTTVDESAKVFTRYIELCKDDYDTPCNPCAGCTNCAYLCVDGDWVRNSYPDEIQELLVQLILQEYQNPFTLNKDQNRIVTSESVNNHSVSYLVTEQEKKGSTRRIQDEEWFLADIRKWMGPYSPLYQKQHIS